MASWQRASREACLQRLTLVVAHHDEHLPFGRPIDRVDVGDVRVVQRRGGLGLGDEALLGDVAILWEGSAIGGGDELQRDDAVEFEIFAR